MHYDKAISDSFVVELKAINQIDDATENTKHLLLRLPGHCTFYSATCAS